MCYALLAMHASFGVHGAFCLVALTSCTTPADPPRSFLTVRADDAVLDIATQLRIRACNEEGAVYDEVYEVGEDVVLPLRIPFTPRGGDTERTFGALVELYDARGVLRAQLRHRGDYRGAAESELSFESECIDHVNCERDEACRADVAGAVCEPLEGPGYDCVAASEGENECQMCRGTECIPLTHTACSSGVCFGGRCVRPASYWPLNGLAGNRADDVVGTTDLEIVGDPLAIFAEGRGRALRFAIDDGLVAPVTVSRVDEREFGYSFWYRATESPPDHGWLIAETGRVEADRALNGVLIAGGVPLGQVRLESEVINIVPSFDEDYDVGDWHHYAFTGGGNEWRIYVDGTMAGRSVVPRPPSPSPFSQIGVGVLNRGARQDYVEGEFDDVLVFDETLDDDTICSLAYPLCE